MNPLSIVALILAGTVFIVGTLSSTNNPMMFIDGHAILIVVGGSVAAASIAFQIDRLFLLMKVFFGRVIRGRKLNYASVIQELMQIAEAYRTNSPALKDLLAKTTDPFIREAMGAVLEEVMDKKGIIKILRARVATMYHRHLDDSIKFKIVGKYPPAFGLMGTTLGMIGLLQKIGQEGGQKLIGPAMSLALVATFYGIALANLVFNPISENLQDSAKETKLKNTIIVEGVALIMDRVNPIVLAEELNSFLLPSERIDWKSLVKHRPAAESEKKEAA
ncbi:MAG: hypothetical protein A2X94_00420 [Bdellovibrionales bacterium GWB1_55_8]|nr:MAG: hypothetical protein A2X94_00420 [Bdellovibrionales bacterium GWB1_55_8]